MITAEELSRAISQTPNWCTLTATAQARVIIAFIQSRAAGVQGITAEWVKGYLASDTGEENTRAIDDAFGEWAALNPVATPQPPKDAGAVPLPKMVGMISDRPICFHDEVIRYGNARVAAARAQPVDEDHPETWPDWLQDLAASIAQTATDAARAQAAVPKGWREELLVNIKRACIRGRNTAGIPDTAIASSFVATCDHIESMVEQCLAAAPTPEAQQGVDVLRIPRSESLDPIYCYFEDFGAGQGRITISCYGDAWTVAWGAMGDRTVRQFVAGCNAHYLASSLLEMCRANKSTRDYVGRIAAAVIAALTPQANPSGGEA